MTVAGDTTAQDTTPLDPELLDEVARQAVDWLVRARDSFRLPDDAVTDADRDRTWKPLGELAELSGYIAVAHPRADIRETARSLLDFAWQETARGELFAELMHREPYATYPVELYGAFARAGLRHPRADALAGVTTRLRTRAVPRDAPTRTLGVLRAEQRIGLTPHGDLDTELARTWLGSLPEPWALERRTAYGLTHDVFHVTDWGRARADMAPRTADYLRLWLPAWLECWLAEEEWDLAGELLAVAACLPTAARHGTAWERLAAAQSTDGSIPENGTLPQDLFRTCYHSTLVAAFAATLALADGNPR
ncbi:DUF6895 family protein [Streptomyces sp. NPDC090106]|uniref:DUF6895 family protein n=1 Tax=Streptomyces sp. NPDC090106 TaxID=3365946 RepID=UPI0037F7AC69